MKHIKIRAMRLEILIKPAKAIKENAINKYLFL
jgi:hypothetical protein